MIKFDKHKDAKTKEKLDLAKAAQNLTYLVSDGEESKKSLNDFIVGSEIDKIEAIYEIEIDTEEKLPFLKTYHNMCRKMGQISYRSPYSNNYFPPIQDGVFPSPLVRNIEEKGRLLFEEYAKLYYGQNCISNFFVEEGEEEFCFAFYAQKRYNNEEWKGVWNSTNVANITGDPTKSITYRVTSSVMYDITCELGEGEPYSVKGNLKKVKNESKKVTPGEELQQFHLCMIGKLIEENETFIRQQIDSVFVKKARDVVDKTRIPQSKRGLEERKAAIKLIMEEKPAPAKQ